MIQYLWRRLILGTRPGLGEGVRVIELASKAAKRRRGNWVIPLFLLIPLIIASSSISITNLSGSGLYYIALRIIAIDYLVFIFGWLAGWNTAVRWRKDQEAMEELAATDLPPSVIGQLLFAGSLSIWGIILTGLFCWDMLFALLTPSRYTANTNNSWDFLALISVPLMIPFFLTLIFFHLETIRIALWMFASAALPRFKLRRRVVGNFFLIPVYVSALTGLGGIFTIVSLILCSVGFSALFFLAGLSFLGAEGDIRFEWFFRKMGPGFTDPLNRELTWAIASVFPLWLIIFSKRLISRGYERRFWESYLHYTWHGAGEREHPVNYPKQYYKQTLSWVSFYAAEEKALVRKKKGK